MSRRGWPAWVRASEIVDLVKLSIPIAISRFAMMVMSLTDAIVLGQNAPDELPYVLNSWLPIGVMLGFSMGILLGVQVLTAELSGQGRAQETSRVFWRGIWVALVMGLVMILLVVPLAGPLFEWVFVGIAPQGEGSSVSPDVIAAETASVTRILALGLPGFTLTTVTAMYLEALRRPLLATGTMYAGALVNLVFDLAFVAGWWGLPQLGAEGVAIATTGTRYFLLVVFAVMILWLTPARRYTIQGPVGEFARQMKVGTGTAISNVAEWGGFNATFVIATWISLAANVVYGYAVQVMGLAFMVYLGIATATSVRVAEHFGRRELDGMRDASRLGVVATLLTGLVLGLIVWLLRDVITLAMVREDAVVDGVIITAALATVMWLVALATCFDGLQATASMALRSQDVVWSPTVLHLGSFFVLMLPLGYHLGLTLGRGAQGMLEAAAIALFVAGIAQVALLEWKTARPNGRAAEPSSVF
ncbi:MAG: MATE family efflux transporter [Hyphomonadaceae bacterium]|nr:MATE family efflux transporter [Hyphomonadaceae bacterium]